MKRIRRQDCSASQRRRIVNAIKGFRGEQRRQAEEFTDFVGHDELCSYIYTMQQWYADGRWQDAKLLIDARETFKSVMALDTDPTSLALYRGLRIAKGSYLEKLKIGDFTTLPVSQTRGFSAWTTKASVAASFATNLAVAVTYSKGVDDAYTGLVARLVSGPGMTLFIAPPSHSVPWFNDLFKKAVDGVSSRFHEHEFGMRSGKVRVKIIRKGLTVASS